MGMRDAVLGLLTTRLWWSIVSVVAPALYAQPYFVIVTASYNNQEWVDRNLRSIFEQTYTHWRLIYINDCSTDNTYDCAMRLIDEYGVRDKVQIINNSVRQGHMANQYAAVHSCPDNVVIVNVDGDDSLIDNQVLEYLSIVYEDPQVWMTYGQFWYWKKDRLGLCRPLPVEVVRMSTVRLHNPWRTSHLRTFYAGLYKKIKIEDLCYQGVWLPMCVDVATMMAMIEMAGEHCRSIDKILYLYNDGNTLCFYHDYEKRQREIEQYIRSCPVYERLNSPPY